MRSEVEKVLQEQRLEKLRRDFEKVKYEDDRRYNHERWLEDQKREILAAKLKKQNGPGGGGRMMRSNSQPDLRPNSRQAAITAYPAPQSSRYENPGTVTTGRSRAQPSFMNANIQN